MNIEISKIREHDIGTLEQLFLSVRRQTFDWLATSEYKLRDFREQTVDEFIFVARCDNIVIGFISLWLPDNFVHHLYVKTEYQGKGVGTALLKEIKNGIAHPIKLKCLKQNKKALNFYQKNGFEEKGSGFGTDGEFFILQYR